MSTFKSAEWRKSSYSGGEHGGCVELAVLLNRIGIRDSKNPAAGHLQISKKGLAVLFREIKTGCHAL